MGKLRRSDPHKKRFSLRELFTRESPSRKQYGRRRSHSHSHSHSHHSGHHNHHSHSSRRNSYLPRGVPISSYNYEYPSSYSPADYYSQEQPSYSTPYTYQPTYTTPQTYEPTYNPGPSRHGRANLTTLPPELKHQIHTVLDPVSSTCLGLSSKTYYPIHCSHHPRTSLFTMAEPEPSHHHHSSSRRHSKSSHSHPLYIYLNRDTNSAYAPREKILDPRTEKYVDPERYKEMERERDVRGERYLWEEGRGERERELRRIWGREGKLGRRRGRGWIW